MNRQLLNPRISAVPIASRFDPQHYQLHAMPQPRNAETVGRQLHGRYLHELSFRNQ